MPIFSEINKIFIHIPRTGGTSIIEYCNAKCKNLNEVYDYQNHELNAFKHHDYWKYNALTDVDKYDMFSVVRNPYTRIVSYFNYHINTDNAVQQELTCHHDLKSKFLYYLDLNLTDQPFKFGRQWPLLVWKTQCSFFPINNHIKIFKYESLNFDLNVYFNETCKLDRVRGIPDNSKTITEIELFTAEAVNKINKYYDSDFYTFDYIKYE